MAVKSLSDRPPPPPAPIPRAAHSPTASPCPRPVRTALFQRQCRLTAGNAGGLGGQRGEWARYATTWDCGGIAGTRREEGRTPGETCVCGLIHRKAGGKGGHTHSAFLRPTADRLAGPGATCGSVLDMPSRARVPDCHTPRSSRRIQLAALHFGPQIKHTHWDANATGVLPAPPRPVGFAPAAMHGPGPDNRLWCTTTRPSGAVGRTAPNGRQFPSKVHAGISNI